MAYNSMLGPMSDYCREYVSSYGSTGGFFLNFILILIIAIMAVTMFNRSSFARSCNNERLTRIEKDVEDTKRIIGEIKDKLDEI